MSRKRPAEDYADFARSAARCVRLKQDDEKEVVKFSKLDSTQQQILLYASIRSLSEKTTQLVPAEPVFTISQVLESRMERYAFTVLISPSCNVYVTDPGPSKVILTHLENHPEWGLTPAVRSTKGHFKIVESTVRKYLTTRRNLLKSLMRVSLGYEKTGGPDRKNAMQNIVTLCEAVVNSAPSSLPKTPKISLQMLARFAFLRQVLEECITKNATSGNKEDYWATVDTSLKKLRENRPTDKEMSRFFTHVLELDSKQYGTGERSHILNETRPLDGLADDDAI
ncbi:hypothetical protein DFP72DRAFT_827858 [Ephemerocybe angulata]|uniref:Uncharacterized protein n=1 Tax=Ephemerocybe angulata TaxID=980116 RepID=A0A8H6HC16_9AGAR|nr:hypothetical protein DFP72DRAFT_827858 [Tulosesus angulatus]